MAAAYVQDLARQIHDGRAVIADAVLPVARRRPGPDAVRIEPPRRLLLAGVVDPTIRSQEGAGVIREEAARAGQLAHAAPRPDLGQRDREAVLIGSRHDDDVAVGQHRVGGIPSAACHRCGGAPRARGARAEEIDVGKTVVVGEVPAGDQQAAVGQECLARAEEERRARDGGKVAGCRVPDLRHAGMAPSQHAPIGQQAQMKIDDWRGERRSPGADGRRIARHVECHGIGRRATGSSVVRPTGHPLVVHPELHRPLLDGLELGLAMGLVLLHPSRAQVETASLLGPDHVIHDVDSARCGVRGEKLVATDVHQVDWTQHTPGRAALVLRRLGTRGRRLAVVSASG